MMVFTEGNTNRECSFFGWDGGFVCLGWMEENKKSGGGDVRSASHPTHIPRHPLERRGRRGTLTVD